MKNKGNNTKVTLYLDEETRNYLKNYSIDTLRTGSISEAVRTIVKEHETRKQEKQ